MSRKCPPGCECGRHTRNRQRKPKVCEECGVSFLAVRANARFCSQKCASDNYSRRNREQIRAAARERYANDPAVREGQRAYRQANREHYNELKRESYRRNPEKALESNRRWREANPETVAEGKRRWENENREKVRDMKRAAARALAPTRPTMRLRHGSNWQEVFAAFWEAQEGCCYLCGDALPAAEPSPWAVVMDHNHDCCPQRRSCEICRRGLACGRCNRLIGLADEDPERLRRIADALDAANALVRERLSQQEYVQGTMF